MNCTRVFNFPSSETWQIKAVSDLLDRRLKGVLVSVDPMARNSKRATLTNDLDPTTSAQHHMEAVEFLRALYRNGVSAEAILFDPPYSPRQIAEHYKAAGLPVTRYALEEVLIVSHGGAHNDTLVTVQRKYETAILADEAEQELAQKEASE